MVALEKLAQITIDCAFAIHRDIGPGLLESVYEDLLADSVKRHGLKVERQKAISFVYNGNVFQDAFRADLLVAERLLVELKSVERTALVHLKQALTYVRLLQLPMGLLINFGAATFREGVQRVINTRVDLSELQFDQRKAPLHRDG